MSKETEPKDKSFCLVLTKNHLVPRFCQYRGGKRIFLLVEERWVNDNDGVYAPGHIDKEYVTKWKPLELPEEDKDKLCQAIDSICNGSNLEI